MQYDLGSVVSLKLFEQAVAFESDIIPHQTNKRSNMTL